MIGGLIKSFAILTMILTTSCVSTDGISFTQRIDVVGIPAKGAKLSAHDKSYDLEQGMTYIMMQRSTTNITAGVLCDRNRLINKKLTIKSEMLAKFRNKSRFKTDPRAYDYQSPIDIRRACGK
ncbi:MAG: hypothetical protein OXC44_02875 [Proteobacteria bacterium]|nr:hypothetical protein [Pseudomonadota bacterium]